MTMYEGSLMNSLVHSLRTGLMFLKFPGISERAFLRFYHRKTILQFRTATVLGIIFYSSVGFIDKYVVPSLAGQIQIIRLFFVCPIFLTAFILSFFYKKELFMQVAGSICIIIAGIGVSIMMAMDQGLGSKIYYGGLILTIMYGYSLLRLRFIYASFAGWVAVFIYIIMAAYVRGVEFPVLINNSLFCVITNFIGMFVSYVLESSLRSEYLHSVAMMKTQREFHKLSLLDPLTRIANKRFFESRMQSEFEEAIRSRQPISVIICDVDHFKDYNDQFGHVQGDVCLKAIAKQLSMFSLRVGIFVSRFGGEEFAIILPNTSLIEARLTAETLRKEIKRLSITAPDKSDDNVVTMSFGVSSIIPTQGARFEDLIQMADDALYKAKENGRDRVEVLAS